VNEVLRMLEGAGSVTVKVLSDRSSPGYTADFAGESPSFTEPVQRRFGGAILTAVEFPTPTKLIVKLNGFGEKMVTGMVMRVEGTPEIVGTVTLRRSSDATNELNGFVVVGDDSGHDSLHVTMAFQSETPTS
jgi:hypothetical protein